MVSSFFLTNSKHYFNASYGVVPKPVREYHEQLLERCEENPYRWFTRDYKVLLRKTRERLANNYLNCDPEDVVFVDNSSSGANSVFEAARQTKTVVLLDTAYSVIRGLAEKHAENVVFVPAFPLENIVKQLERTLENLKQKEKVLVCIDHIASCPGIVMPVCALARVCQKRKIPVLVDGAHALGQVELNLKAFEESGVSYWVSDAHKWFFSPKGSAVLWASKQKQGNQEKLRPSIDCASIGSPGCTVMENQENETSSLFQKRFEYLGTKDYTPWISLSGAMDFIEKEFLGYRTLIERNRQLAVWGQDYLQRELKTHSEIKPDSIASMINVRLPIHLKMSPRALMEHLESLGIYTVVFEYPQTSGEHWIRLCVQWFVDKESIHNIAKELLKGF